ncbi:MAG: hypothetical protein HY720_32815 [Planctomycetes bacterium]|nr:hypothetical protein [Planctomycetota bacterium]
METNPESRFDRLQLFVPEGERASKTIPVDLHDRWVVKLLRLCGRLFGGATSYGRGVGVWEDGSTLEWDRVTVIESWLDLATEDLCRKLARLRLALREMGKMLDQKAVFLVLGDEIDTMEIGRDEG